MKVKCEECRTNFEHPFAASEKPLASCPSCHKLNTVGKRPDFKVRTKHVPENWDPWCRNCGEFNNEDRARRMKDGSLRVDPKTGVLSGYFPTRKEYLGWLKQKGVMNGWGEGEIVKERQGWDQRERG